MSVFGHTSAEISSSFLHQMPESLSREDFFKESCPDIKIVCQFIDNKTTYSLEGHWESVLRAQFILSSCLDKWKTDLQVQKHVGLEELVEESVEFPSEPESAKEVENSSSCCDIPVSILRKIPSTAKLNEEQLENVQPYLPLNSCEFPLKSSDRKEFGDKSVKLSPVRHLPLRSPKEEAAVGEKIHLQAKISDEGESNVDESGMESEVCSDHNYINLREEGAVEQDNTEKPIENEIYMDIQLSKMPGDKIFRDPNFPFALVLTSEDHPRVEVVQLKIDKDDMKTAPAVEVNSNDYFKDRQELLKMRKKKYEDDTPFKYFCSKCSFKTKRKSHMTKHSRLHERVCKIYSCSDCEFSSIRLCHLQRHIRIHKTSNFSCSLCLYTTHKEELLARHHRNKHKKEETEETAKDKYQCMKCSYMTSSEKFLERHMTIHAKEVSEPKAKLASFKCEHCSYKSPSRSNYYRHISSVHGDERPYLCTTCGLSFKRSDTLIQHRATHVDIDPQLSFPCPQCTKFYRSEKLLRDHLLTHAEERSFLCEICGAAFKTRVVQRKHFQEVHVQNKSHACSLCEKKFLSKSLVKRHMKVHEHVNKRPLIAPLYRKTKPELKNISVKDWNKSYMSVPSSSEDMQVLIIQSDQEQQLDLNQSTILIQSGPFPQPPSGSGVQEQVEAQALTLPVEFMIPEQVETVVMPQDQDSSGENLVTLAFA